MKVFKYLMSLVLGLILIISCKKENDTPSPKIVFSQDTVVFKDINPLKVFLSSQPLVNYEFQVLSYPDWVTVKAETNHLWGELDYIEIIPKVSAQTTDIYSGKVVIMSTLGSDTITLKGYFGLQIPDSLIFSEFVNTLSFPIVNENSGTLTYSLSSLNKFVSFDVKSGTLSSDQCQNIQVSTVRDSMLSGTYYSDILVLLNNQIDTIHVKINHFKEQKKILDCDIADAEYSKAKDILVYVSYNPSSLNIFDPSTETSSRISLDYIPTCVSISQDGNTSVVGHNAHLTYVDLVAKNIIGTYNISCEAFDIVLANNNWAYVFPNEDQWERIRCVNLNLTTDNEQLHTGMSIYEKTNAKLDPSGKYIYGAYNNIEKYDIQNGQAKYLYESSYYSYNFSNNLWLSEDGLRIFTKGKYVLKTSELSNYDLIYNGTIVLTPFLIEWLDYSSIKNNLYLVSTEYYGLNSQQQPYIYVYDASNLSYKTKYKLEKFLVPDYNGGGTFYAPEPYFVFSNSSGDYIYIITKAIGSGLSHEWAIQTLKI